MSSREDRGAGRWGGRSLRDRLTGVKLVFLAVATVVSTVLVYVAIAAVPGTDLGAGDAAILVAVTVGTYVAVVYLLLFAGKD